MAKPVLRSSTKVVAKYSVNEKVLCFHQRGSTRNTNSYEARVLDIRTGADGKTEYFVHYHGWNTRWDEWVNDHRLLELNEENLKKRQEIANKTVSDKSKVDGGGSQHSRSSQSGGVSDAAQPSGTAVEEPRISATKGSWCAMRDAISQLICPCLNITINVVVEDRDLNNSIVKMETIKQLYNKEVINDPFFQLCQQGEIARFVHRDENGIVEKLPPLLRKRTVANEWDIRQCLLCGADAYAVRSNNSDLIVLVNMKLFLHDSDKIKELQGSADISPVFQVIIPKTVKPSSANANMSACRAGNEYFSYASTNLSDEVVRSVKDCNTLHLAREQEAMEERICQFTNREHSAFGRKEAEAKLEEAILLRFLTENAAGGRTFCRVRDGGTMADMSSTPEISLNQPSFVRQKRQRLTVDKAIATSVTSHADAHEDAYSNLPEHLSTGRSRRRRLEPGGNQQYLATVKIECGTPPPSVEEEEQEHR